jgi:O-antigen/teichoic acid export membrane protein
LTNLETVAIYSLGHRIAKIVGVVLIIPFQMAFEPFVFANLGKPKIRATIASLLTYLIFISVFVTFGVAVFAKAIIQIMAPEAYAQAYFVVLLILPVMAFRGIYYVGEAMLHVRKKTLVSGGIVALIGGCSLLSNYALISWAGLYGAVLAFDLAVACMGLLTLVLGMKVFPVPLELQRLLALGALLVILLGAVFIMDGVGGHAYYPLLATLAGLSLLGLYLANFFNRREMSVAKGVWQDLKTSLA